MCRNLGQNALPTAIVVGRALLCPRNLTIETMDAVISEVTCTDFL